MDAALAKLFVSNAQWVKAVNTTEPGFFEGSAKGQTPKVRLRLRFFPHHVRR
jgi:carbonic anhydrase